MPEPLPALALVVALLALAAAAAGAHRAVVAAGEGRTVRTALGEPLQEVARLLVQRRRTTVAPDALLWRLSGGGLLVVAALLVAVVPLGARPVVDLPVGVVWVNAMDVVLWSLWWLLGWGPNAARPLLGGYRFLGLALAYELPLMFALTGPAVRAGSLDLTAVVAAQDRLWNVLLMPVGFAVVLGCTLAFAATGPFAHPAGDDLGGGVLDELSGPDLLVVRAGRWAVLVAGTASTVALFLGGGGGPVLPGPVWFALKTVLLLALLEAVRDRLPVLRADRLLEAGFLVALPLTVLQLLVPSLLVVGRG